MSTPTAGVLLRRSASGRVLAWRSVSSAPRSALASSRQSSDNPRPQKATWAKAGGGGGARARWAQGPVHARAPARAR
eukprot:3566609-Lingulodinium_polyedra.AAC.1